MKKVEKFVTKNSFKWVIPTDLKVKVHEFNELKDRNFKKLLPVAREVVARYMPDQAETRVNQWTGVEFTYLHKEGEELAKKLAFVQKGSLHAYEINWITLHLLKGDRPFEAINVENFRHKLTGIAYDKDVDYSTPMGPKYTAAEKQAYYEQTRMKLSFLTNKLMLEFVNAAIAVKAIDDSYLELIKGDEPEPEVKAEEAEKATEVKKVKKVKKVATKSTKSEKTEKTAVAVEEETKVESTETKTEEVKVENS